MHKKSRSSPAPTDQEEGLKAAGQVNHKFLYVVMIISVLLIAFGARDYADQIAFTTHGIRAQGTIISSREESTIYGGMSRLGGHLHEAYLCSYGIKFQAREKTEPVVAKLKTFTSFCFAEGQTIPILYNPDDTSDVETFDAGKLMPVGKLLIILGVFLGAFSYFVWLNETRVMPPR